MTEVLKARYVVKKGEIRESSRELTIYDSRGIKLATYRDDKTYDK